MTKWQWILKQFSRKLWVRASLFCVLAILTAFVGILAQDSIPEAFSRKVGAQSVDGILQIIANSMLVVATFSLSVMVSAYSAATNNVTPRSTQLLLQDTTSQNALSVFIGAFLFSLVGIIALSQRVYGDSGRLILFAVTLIVVVIIIATLLQWINYLSKLGRVGHTINTIELATAKAIKERIKKPYLGGRELKDFTPKNSYFTVACETIGYIRNIDVSALSVIAEKNDIEFFIPILPGDFNDGTKPLLYSTKSLENELKEKVIEAFDIGKQRSFEQDPRFGLVVLSEIASRALSHAVNDPGTAIDIISTGVRTLAPWITQKNESNTITFPKLYIPALQTKSMLDDIFMGAVRDGASMVEVGVRLQSAFISIASLGDESVKKQVKELSKYAIRHATEKLVLKEEVEKLERQAAAIDN